LLTRGFIDISNFFGLIEKVSDGIGFMMVVFEFCSSLYIFTFVHLEDKS